MFPALTLPNSLAKGSLGQIGCFVFTFARGWPPSLNFFSLKNPKISQKYTKIICQIIFWIENDPPSPHLAKAHTHTPYLEMYLFLLFYFVAKTLVRTIKYELCTPGWWPPIAGNARPPPNLMSPRIIGAHTLLWPTSILHFTFVNVHEYLAWSFNQIISNQYTYLLVIMVMMMALVMGEFDEMRVVSHNGGDAED